SRRQENTPYPTPRAPLPRPRCLSQTDGAGGGRGGWPGLQERAVAVESCLFIVQVLRAARRRIIGLGLLPVSQCAGVDLYLQEVEDAVRQLRPFVFRAQGNELVRGDWIASAIESQQWTLRQLKVGSLVGQGGRGRGGGRGREGIERMKCFRVID
ncbi:unnamed protein product, partial [Discosporangium mesarthrocarpum]